MLHALKVALYAIDLVRVHGRSIASVHIQHCDPQDRYFRVGGEVE